jgi:hypothetical protein
MRRVGYTIALAAGLAFAPPAAAVQFVLGVASPVAVPGNNDFKTDLADLGLTEFTGAGATLSLSGPGRITFYRLGSESSLTNSFTGGSVNGVEADGNFFGSPILLGTDSFAAGSLSGKLFFTSGGSGMVTDIGDAGFGIFVPKGVKSIYQSNVVYFGMDDFINNDDDNHDDFIIKAVVGNIPEPQTWAMMILGFGLVGFAARRSGRSVTA